MLMRHKSSFYDPEQLEALTPEAPLAFQPVVSVHSVQFGAEVRWGSQ